MSIFKETDFMHSSCPYDAGPIIIIPVTGEFFSRISGSPDGKRPEREEERGGNRKI